MLIFSDSVGISRANLTFELFLGPFLKKSASKTYTKNDDFIVEAGPTDYFPTKLSQVHRLMRKTGQLPQAPANELRQEDGNTLSEPSLPPTASTATP